jgi:hypothetical protein
MTDEIANMSKMLLGAEWDADSEVNRQQIDKFWFCALNNKNYGSVEKPGTKYNCPYCVAALLTRNLPYSNYDAAAHTPLNQHASGEIKLGKLVIRVPIGTIFFLDQFRDSFAHVPVGDHFETHKIKSRAFRRIAVNWIVESTGNPTQSKIADLLGVCEGMAVNSGLFYSLHNRYASDGRAIYIDLGDDEWRVARITKENWSILESKELPYPMFRRYPHFKHMGVADSGTKDDYLEYLKLFNVKEEDKVLDAALLASRIIPDYPHIIGITIGPQGSAKTWHDKLVRMLVDNSQTLTLHLSTKSEQLAQDLMHNYMPVFDNTDMLQDWQSDMLCRAVTGEGVTKRELYSDDDDIIYKYQRCVQLNGINPPGLKADFVDRALTIELDRIPKTSRLTDEEVTTRAEQLAPKVIAYLYDVVVAALNLYDEVKSELTGRLPRMADACIYGEACARAMGYAPLAFYNAYMRKLNAASKEVITNSVIGTLLLAYLDEDQFYLSNGITETEPTACYQKLVELAKAKSIDIRERGFPKAPNALGRKLRQIKPNLLEFGVEFEDGHSGRNSWVFRKNVDSGEIPSKPSMPSSPNDTGLGRYMDDSKKADGISKGQDAVRPIVQGKTDDKGQSDDVDDVFQAHKGEEGAK